MWEEKTKIQPAETPPTKKPVEKIGKSFTPTVENVQIPKYEKTIQPATPEKTENGNNNLDHEDSYVDKVWYKCAI